MTLRTISEAGMPVEKDKQPFASEGKNHSKLDWVMQKSSNKGGSMHDNGRGGID